MPRLADPQLPARRRAQILEAALACFRRRGFHQATMQEICAEARVSPGALYRYFASKADIITAIAEDEHARLEPMLVEVGAGGPFLPGLLRFVAAVFERWFSGQNASVFADVLAEAARDRDIAQRVSVGAAALQDKLTTAVAAAQARGEVATDISAPQAARLIAAAIDGVGLRAVLRDDDPTDALKDFSTMVSRLLRPDPHPTPFVGRTFCQPVQDTAR